MYSLQFVAVSLDSALILLKVPSAYFGIAASLFVATAAVDTASDTPDS
jgi:hypothetical protein